MTTNPSSSPAVVTAAGRDAAGELYMALGFDVPHENDGNAASMLETIAISFAEQRYFTRLAQPASPEARLERRFCDTAEALAWAERDYRQAHDLYGDDSRESGRAWDLMRRAGDKLRAILSELNAGGGK